MIARHPAVQTASRRFEEAGEGSGQALVRLGSDARVARLSGHNRLLEVDRFQDNLREIHDENIPRRYRFTGSADSFAASLCGTDRKRD
jgi:hypothetical protein